VRDNMLYLKTNVDVSAWIDLPFAANWASLDGAHFCSYRKDGAGRVYLRGIAYPLAGYAYGGANSTIATLPVGYRPTQDVSIFVLSYESSTAKFYNRYLVVASGGAIYVNGVTDADPDTGSASNWWTLDNIVFWSL
jgi:hypothetical protein